MSEALHRDQLRTPLGVLRFTVTADGVLRRLGWDLEPEALEGARQARDPAGVTSALAAYFAGELHALDALAADGEGTDFQRRVWRALRRIPASATASYGEIARAICAPRASRAVGAANGRNLIALVVPCHRILGADGQLTGYAGGLARKRWLLDHERRHAIARVASQGARSVGLGVSPRPG